MRKVTVLEHISMDGVIQAPGGRDEDSSDGFMQGGWIAPYADAVVGTLLRRQMNLRFDLLLGRKTHDIWSSYWPKHVDAWPGANTATKYVASNTLNSGDWKPAVILSGDVAKAVANLKRQPGPELHVWGSSNLVKTLLKHDLVDAFWLMIYPLTLGSGKRLFADGSRPAAFTVTESYVAPNGVIVVNYARASADKAS